TCLSGAVHRSSFIVPRFLMRSDRSHVLQGHGDAVAGERLLERCVDEVAPVLEGYAVAGAVATQEIALLEERPLLGVEVQLDVGAYPVPPQRGAGVDADLAGVGVAHRQAGRERRLLVRREPGQAEVLVRVL